MNVEYKCYPNVEIAKSIKSLIKMKQSVFYFMEKSKRTFWPTQYVGKQINLSLIEFLLMLCIVLYCMQLFCACILLYFAVYVFNCLLY